MLQFLFFFLLGWTSLAADSSQNQTYVSKDKTFQIQFPARWEKLESVYMGLDMMVAMPLTEQKGMVRESVSVIFSRMDEPITLESFYEESLRNLKESLLDFQIINSGEAEISGKKVKWIIYSDRDDHFETTALQYFLVDLPRVYLITGTADTDEFEKFKPIFEDTIKTFTLLNHEKAGKSQ